MIQETLGQAPVFTAEQFVEVIESKDVPNQELSRAIRDTLKDLFGELSAITILCYVGDASSNDLMGFAKRTDELLGSGASMVLGSIIASAVSSQ